MNGSWCYVGNGMEVALAADGSLILRAVGDSTTELQPPIPEIPAECHNTRPIDPETCMAAVRAMCGEGK